MLLFGMEDKKMKRVIAVILVLCMALSLCACSSSGSGSASGEKVIKIGVFEPSSGDSASGGKKEILGMQYANSQEPTVTLGGETYKVELVYGDNGSSTDKAPSAASSLVSAGVSVVLGSYGSGVSMAGGPKFEEAGIPAIGITCTNPNVTAGNSYYFRICFLDNFQADVLANFAVSKFSAKTAYCLGESGNEYDQGLIAFFTKVFEAAGGKVITDSFPTGNSDFGSYLNKAKSEGADVIFTPVSIAYAVQIITQAASLGIEAPFLGSDTLDDNMVLEAIKGTDLQLYVSTFYQEGGAPEFDTGVKEYINASSEALAANGGNDTISAVTAMGRQRRQGRHHGRSALRHLHRRFRLHCLRRSGRRHPRHRLHQGGGHRQRRVGSGNRPDRLRQLILSPIELFGGGRIPPPNSRIIMTGNL